MEIIQKQFVKYFNNNTYGTWILKTSQIKFRFHCYKMTWLKNGKRQVTKIVGAGTKKDILQCVKDCGIKIFELIRITDKNEIAKLERKYIVSHRV